MLEGWSPAMSPMEAFSTVVEKVRLIVAIFFYSTLFGRNSMNQDLIRCLFEDCICRMGPIVISS